jgi:hypothetical protein
MIETDSMTPEEVKELVHSQAVGSYAKINDHRISLNQALISPRLISIIAKDVRDGHVSDRLLSAWLVGQESDDGYKIVMNEDGSQFGLVSKGFPADKYPILCGWYGGLISAFLAM